MRNPERKEVLCRLRSHALQHRRVPGKMLAKKHLRTAMILSHMLRSRKPVVENTTCRLARAVRENDTYVAKLMCLALKQMKLSYSETAKLVSIAATASTSEMQCAISSTVAHIRCAE